VNAEDEELKRIDDMFLERPMYNSDGKSEAEQLNDKLLQKRAQLREAELTKYAHDIEAIRRHVANTEYDAARTIALKLQDSMIYREIIDIFKEHPQVFICAICDTSIKGIALREDSLSWISPQVCDKCKEEEELKEKDRQKRAYKQFVERNMEQILLSLGVEYKLLDASYEGYSRDEIQSCRRATAAKHGIYVWGDTGSGKSWLTVAVIKELMSNQEHITRIMGNKSIKNYDEFRHIFRLVFVPWLLTILRDSYESNNSSTEKEIITLYSSIPVLILDDIGTERPNDWVREKLNTIVYFRNSRGLKTMYTSNWDPDTLAQTLGKRITSRIFQDCEIIHLTYPDRRRHVS